MRYSFCPKCGGKLLVKTSKNEPICNSCQFVFYQNPIVGVAAIVMKDDQILLGKRTKGHKWCIPCGYVEYDEDVREAVKREFFEETGLHIETKSVYEVHSNFHNPNQHTVGIWFLADVIGGKLAASDDLCDVRYFSFHQLPELAFATDAKVLQKLKEDGLL